ncbi:hypothetical protein ACFL2O_10250 [Thermodesulfobacteriota bacterium]
MNSYLDIRTLSALTSFVNLTICVIMLYVYRTRKTYQGFSQWVYSALLLFIGMFLLSMRHLLPELVTVIIANTLIACFFVLLLQGIHIFFQKKIPLWYYVAPIVLTALFFTYYTYISPNISARIIVITFLGFACYALAAYSVHIETRKMPYGLNILLIITLALQALYFLFRIIYTLLVETGIQDFMTSSTVQSIAFLVPIVGNIALFVGLIILNSQRVESDLVEAKSEIKQLTGILPICSYCKKIRDDQGYYEQIESYMRKHSGVDFSHTICPECMEKHYSELNSPATEENGE